MKRIAVFASGGGTDFQSIIDANEREKFCEIKYLIASKAGIGAIARAEKAGIETAVFSKSDCPSLEEAGKGFYGLKVNEAAIEYGVKVSGATVHFVEADVDAGAIIMQRAVPVEDGDTPESLQARILKIEHEILPLCVKLLCEGKIEKTGRKIRILDEMPINIK